MSDDISIARVRLIASQHLGPYIEITDIRDNALACVPEYGQIESVPDCWRVGYSLKRTPTMCVGSDTPYLLISKKEMVVIKSGIEHGE